MKHFARMVLAVNPHSGGEQGQRDPQRRYFCLHLARHGVNPKAEHIQAEDIAVGDMLLSRAGDEGIDLMVCDGHRRLRELVLGGVTRHLLRHMTMPVLMSH
jgi:nucleotide-binding universal stress UspA family protein